MGELISVIIPIYNVEAYLDECIASVIAQTYSNLEIILVDDGSPDNCPQMCDEWAAKDGRIKVIHKENGGISDARNAAIDIATGDYIAFVDSDDWIEPRMYEIMLAALKKENADICACTILSCFPERRVAWGFQEYTTGNSEKILSLLYRDTAYPVAIWNKLYRRYLWDDLRFPVGKICEDAFTTYLLVDKASKIVQIPETLYCYRIRENSTMTAAFSYKRMDEEEAWRCNYEFVRTKYPQLKKIAFDFYLQKVNTLMHTIPNNQREEFQREYSMLRSILRKNLIYILLSSSIGFKQRIKIMLDYFK